MIARHNPVGIVKCLTGVEIRIVQNPSVDTQDRPLMDT